MSAQAVEVMKRIDKALKAKGGPKSADVLIAQAVEARKSVSHSKTREMLLARINALRGLA